MGPGLGLGLGSMRSGAEAASPPPANMLVNGGFADGTGWTLAPGSGGAAIAIVSGQMVYTGANSGGHATATQTVSGLAAHAGQTLTLTVDLVANTASQRPSFSLGGATIFLPSATPGPYSMAVVVGGSNEDLVVSAVLIEAASRGYTIDNLTLTT